MMDISRPLTFLDLWGGLSTGVDKPPQRSRSGGRSRLDWTSIRKRIYMKKLFTAIRASDLEMVRQVIEKKPALVNCVAKQRLRRTTDSRLCRSRSKRGISLLPIICWIGVRM